MSELLNAINELTRAQAAAVNWESGPLFVLAGPGSGKTRILTTRIARLLSDTPKQTFRVLALTFTNNAADEMRNRIEKLAPGQQDRAVVGTFHSFCMQMLQQHGSHVGISPNFAIYSHEEDRKDILRSAIRKNGLDSADERFLATIDGLKTRLILPKGSSKYFRDANIGHRIELVYSAYEEALQKTNALDFGSLVMRSFELISTSPGIASHYRRAYPHWMFDEFQDTNDGQYRLIKALAGDVFRNVFAVADDDQIIYQWNGASFNQIKRFREDFQPTELQLPTNYRCPPSIVAAANRLVVHNKQRTEEKLPLESGKLITVYGTRDQIRARRFSTDEAEAAGISASISEMSPSMRGKVVVLARTRALLASMQTALSQKGVAATIAQRRDDFSSAQFQWMTAALRLALRPLDFRALETLTGAFNRWFGSAIWADEVVRAAEISSRSLVAEWVELAIQTDDMSAIRVAQLVGSLQEQPTSYKKFIDEFLAALPQESENQATDIEEDRSAWSVLVTSINQSIGRSAPLELFLQELALRSKEPPVGPNVVTLMTIHNAKGKEFDHVFVVGLAESVLPSFQSLKAGEQSVEMEEERRNCFVAITRAKEWLCLSYADRYRGWSKQPSRFLVEMQLTLPSVPER